ncbi:MAPEG family protein [Paracoccus sp. MC1854]|uniref:MAPEG family protein n=1 Tax=Paracoccus sp. MC1854 TaxID=2760306 RepID=UPI001601D54D|nr:MAPEG family protein [Paracoccus sp. MC1854]MBB1491010.1 MAPEG family protein [Paracoccus sp. MC1854]
MIPPSPELLVLGLAAILQAVQIGLAGWSMGQDGLQQWNVAPRDREPQFSARTSRLRRAVNNHFEALAFFTIAVVLVQFTQSNTGFTAACAWAYLLARILYVPAYALGWSPWRSLIFGVGFLATMLMILTALF